MKNLEKKTKKFDYGEKPSLKAFFATGFLGFGSYEVIAKSLENFYDAPMLSAFNIIVAGVPAGCLSFMFGTVTYYALKKKITGKYPQNKIFGELVSQIMETSNMIFKSKRKQNGNEY